MTSKKGDLVITVDPTRTRGTIDLIEALGLLAIRAAR